MLDVLFIQDISFLFRDLIDCQQLYIKRMDESRLDYRDWSDGQLAGEEPGDPMLSSMIEDFLCTASSLLKAFSVASVSSSSSSDNLWQNFLLLTPSEIHSSLKLRLNIENAGSPVT